MPSSESTRPVSPANLLLEARAQGLQVIAIGHRLIVRGPADANQALVQALLTCKPELMPLLQREANAGSDSDGCAHPFVVRERHGNLVRIAGLDGWLSIRDLRPCGDCGGTRFRLGQRRLFCSNCLKPRASEQDAAEIDVVAALAQEEIRAGMLEDGE
jgi:hypothetical protein